MELPSHNPAAHPSSQVSARHTEVGDRFNRTLFSAVDAFESAGISYALIGGVAISGQGRPRSTHDIDLFVRPEDAEASLEALNKAGFKTEKTDKSWLFKGWKEEILVDIIFKSSGDIYFDDEMDKHARVVNFHGKDVRVVCPEDLVIIKCAVHNEIGPHHWHDALALLSHAKLDWDYLIRRARRAPRRLLALLIYAQSNDIWIPNRIIQSLYQTVYHDVPIPESAPLAMPPKTGVPELRVASKEPYVAARIKDALARDPRTIEQDVKVIVGESHVIVRGECSSERQRVAIEEVIKSVAQGYSIDNHCTVQHFPGPEGVEAVR